MDYLGDTEKHRVNKCITSQITDFEQAILAQVSDKWKPLTLADGVFDLDELKLDISASDAKFAVRKVQADSTHSGVLNIKGKKATSATSLLHDSEIYYGQEETGVGYTGG